MLFFLLIVSVLKLINSVERNFLIFTNGSNASNKSQKLLINEEHRIIRTGLFKLLLSMAIRFPRQFLLHLSTSKIHPLFLVLSFP